MNAYDHMKTKSLLLLLSLSFGFSAAIAQGNYTLTVEEHAVDIVPGQTTYRMYVDLVNPDDFLSSVFGNDVDELSLETENGFYNDPLGASVATGINPAFIAFFPTIGADSWITIGLESQNVGDQVAISTVEDAEQPFVPAFASGSAIDGENIVLNTSTGGAWFVLNGTPNGLPDADGRVLIMQLTTTGGFSGILPVQVFENGNGANDMRFTFAFDGVGTFGEAVSSNGGCTDSSACNYDADATEDDGSCTYADAGYDCDGACLNDADSDGVCDEFESAGCTDGTACNYDAAATDDDGSCTYADDGYDCDGVCLNDSDGDGTCDEFETVGCTDAAACNYAASATDDDGSCTYAETGYGCDGACLDDVDGDGICDEFETAGCTDAMACNYDATATDDDGSCTFDDCAGSYTLTVEEYAVDIVPGQTTYRMYVDLVNPDDFVSSVFGNDVDELSLETENGFYNDPMGASVATGINPAFIAFFPTIGADSWITIGLDSQNVGDQVAVSTVEDAEQPFVPAFASGSAIDGQNIVINTSTGGAWFVLNGTPNGLPDEDGRVLILQLTTSGGLSGVLPVQVFENGNGANDMRFTFEFDGPGTFGEVVSSNDGCTDSSACNYDADATDDDGSCTYADAGYDCDGACLNDADSDGVCDEFESAGCTDGTACNYDAAATDDDGSCTYPETAYDCNGACLNDFDGDGICDEFESVGCTDAAACNYATSATDDDGSCTYADAGYDCDGVCLDDVDGDGICDEFETAGCTNVTACNYDATATDDDGSCTYAETGYDCAGSCIDDADGDGICDEFETAGCTDATACNYDAAATDDDGSCTFGNCTEVYTLTVEEHAVDIVPGQTTYRMYIDLVNSDDFLSSVYGNDVDGLLLETENGFYNDVFGASVATGINPAFIATFPTIAADSWITIGLESQNVGDQVAISTVEDTEQPFVAAFASGSAIDGQNIAINTSTGGAWFVLNGTPNGLPDEDGRVLIMQLTTSGGLSGTLPIQIFENGSGFNDLRMTFEFDGTGTFGGAVTVNVGCTNEAACNYDAAATEDDGSCSFAEEFYDCAGACLNDADGDGVCDELEIAGCTNEAACNFDPAATSNDGSCSYPETGYDCDSNCLVDSDGDGICDAFEAAGCTDPAACNFDVNATEDDGSCASLDACGDCGGLGVTGCGIQEACNYDPAVTCSDSEACDYDSCAGCMDSSACNYDPGASVPAGCDYPDLYWLDCDGNCLEGFDEDGDGVCDPDEVPGCTDPDAVNYNPDATSDNGTCIIIIVGCGNSAACNYDPAVTINAPGLCDFPDSIFEDCDGNCFNDEDGDGVCDEMEILGCTTPGPGYNPFATEDDGSCQVGGCIIPSPVFACNYDPDADFLIFSMCVSPPCEGMAGSPTPEGQLYPGCTDVYACNYDAGATEDDGSCEYQTCIGCTDETACNYDPTAIYNDGTCDYVSCAVSGCTNANACNYDPEATVEDGTCDFTSCYGCTDPSADNYDPDALYDSGTCEILGCTLAAACNYDPAATTYDASCDFTSCEGCMNEAACDYDPTATIAGTCDYISCQGCTDASADNYDPTATQDDGSCEFIGCSVMSACNYDPNANVADNNQCAYAEDGYDCDGNCLNDADADGVCDEFEVAGCTDATACNYDASTTDDDGSCTYLEEYYDCNGNCVNDIDSDGVCDELELTGCTDEMACNYDATATDNDGSCSFAEEFYDCDGTCLNDVDGDGICDELEMGGCTEATACNYDGTATDNDGSCSFAEEFYDCNGNCLDDADGDGICDALEMGGCTEATACNYDAGATDDDGSCIFADEFYDCSGTCLSDADGDGICDELEVTGCTDEMACNYDATATDDDESCTYAEEFYDCDGTCLNDTDGDGVCDELEIAGCTDELACNYDSAATDDDESCTYAEEFYDCDGNCLNDADGDGVCDELEVEGCTDPEAENYNADATEDDGSCYYCDIEIAEDATTDEIDGAATGSIDVTITGGTGSLTIAWTGPDNFTSDQEDLTDLFAGLYTITVTDENGCAQELQVEVGATTDLAEISELQFSLYPNPADETLWINASGWSGLTTLALYDAAGRQIASEVYNIQEAMPINVSGLAPGLYQLVVLNADQRGVAQVLIQ